jgi:hypothetical protein
MNILQLPRELYHIIGFHILSQKQYSKLLLWNAYEIFKFKLINSIVSKEWNIITDNVVTTLITTLIQNSSINIYKNPIPLSLNKFIGLCDKVAIENIIIPAEIVDDYLGINLFNKKGIVSVSGNNLTLSDFCTLCKTVGDPFHIFGQNGFLDLQLTFLVNKNSYFKNCNNTWMKHDLSFIINFLNNNPILTPFGMLDNYSNPMIVKLLIRNECDNRPNPKDRKLQFYMQMTIFNGDKYMYQNILNILDHLEL